MNRDYYTVLGIGRNASPVEIKEAYRKQARIYHPDRNRHVNAQALFQEINEAHTILSDPIKRRTYDSKGQAGLDANKDGLDLTCFNCCQIFCGIFWSTYREKRDEANVRRRRPSDSYRPSRNTNREEYSVPNSNLRNTNREEYSIPNSNLKKPKPSSSYDYPPDENSTRPSTIYQQPIPRAKTNRPILRPPTISPVSRSTLNRPPRAGRPIHYPRGSSVGPRRQNQNLRPEPRPDYSQKPLYYRPRYSTSAGPHLIPSNLFRSTNLIDICIVSRQLGSSKLLTVNINDSIAIIKMGIEERMGVPIDRQCLEFRGVLLHDNQILADIIPGVGSTLVLTII